MCFIQQRMIVTSAHARRKSTFGLFTFWAACLSSKPTKSNSKEHAAESAQPQARRRQAQNRTAPRQAHPGLTPGSPRAHIPKRFFLCLGVPGSERPLGVEEPEREPPPGPGVAPPGVAPPGVDAGVAARPEAPMGVMPRDWRAPG